MTPPKKILLVTFGQSNCLGTHSTPTSNELLLDYLANPVEDVYILSDTGDFEQLDYLSGNQKGADTDDNTSILSATYHLNNILNLDFIGVVKYSVGATSIWTDWSIGSAYLNTLIDQIKTTLSLFDWDEVHLLNVQGERDVTYPTVPYSYSQDWGVQMEEIIGEIEANISKEFKTITLVKLNESINKDVIAIGYQRGEVDRLVNSIPRYFSVDANKLELYTDDLHYTSRGQNKLGIEWSKIVLGT